MKSHRHRPGPLWPRRIAALARGLLVRAMALAVVFSALAASPSEGRTAAKPFDFNGDGYADLPVGVPFDDLGTAGGRISDAGSINVLYGSERGVTARGDQLRSQRIPDIAEGAEQGDRFGHAMASVDFDRDGYADLVVAAPGESIAGAQDAGVVHVLYGTSEGVGGHGSQLWDKQAAMGSTPQPWDGFGTALTVADWNRDGFADLAIGIPRDDVAGVKDAGSVAILYGSSDGLTAAGANTWTKDSPGIAGAPGYRACPDPTPVDPAAYDMEYPELFGAALAAGDLDGDGFPDLAVGVPGVTLPNKYDYPQWDAYGAGAVHVLYGSSQGVTAAGDQVWHQERRGVRGEALARHSYDDCTRGESFGSALTIEDFNGDGHGDLAVGTPFDDEAGCSERQSEGLYSCERGSVNVLYGSRAGLTATGDDLWELAVTGLSGTYGEFGRSLASGRANRDGHADLVVGAPRLKRPRGDGFVFAGGVLVLRGSADGLVSKGKRLWAQDRPGIAHRPEQGDRFGESVALRDLGRSRRPELVIGVPGEDLAGIQNVGLVHVLYGSRRGPVAEGSQAWSRQPEGVRGAARPDDGFGYLEGSKRMWPPRPYSQ